MLIPFTTLLEKYKLKVTGIIHIGASTGQEMPEYSKNKVDNVVWIEADPKVYGQLVGNMMNYPMTRCINATISDKTAKNQPFYITDNNGESSSLLPMGTHEKDHPNVKVKEEIRVDTVRFDDLAKLYQIDLRQYNTLNMDIQGVELMALKGMPFSLEFFEHIYLEVNEREVYKGNGLVTEVDALLQEAGFVGVEVKMTEAGWGDKLYVRPHVLQNANPDNNGNMKDLTGLTGANGPQETFVGVNQENEQLFPPPVPPKIEHASPVGLAVTELEAVMRALHGKISQEASGSTADNITAWVRTETTKIIKKFVK